MSRNLALVLRGISFYDDAEKKVCNSPTVDYKECYESFCKNLFKPLQTIFDNIDVFLVTYNNPKLSDLINDFEPKDMRIYSSKSIYSRDKNEITAILISDSIDLVEGYMNFNQLSYSNVMIVRFDLFYPISLPVERLKMNSINFGWLGTYGQCDDCFHMFTPGHISKIRQYIPYHNIDGYMHGLNHAFTDVHYLCKRGPSSEELYPDFYIFQRRLKEYKDKRMKLIEIFPNEWNWRLFDKPQEQIITESYPDRTLRHVVIITSCINVSNAPLCYSPVRSVFTPQERLDQTLKSISTVKEKIPNVTIVLMNNNFLTDEQHRILIDQCNYVFIFDSIRLDNILFTADLAKTFPNKNCTETASLYYACKRIEELKLQYDYLWKLSGRYSLLPLFNTNNWTTKPNNITVPPRQPNGSINNVMYSIPKKLVPKYLQCLKKCYILCYNDPDCKKGCMVEHSLFDYQDIYFLPQLAQVTGQCSHLEEKQFLVF